MLCHSEFPRRLLVAGWATLLVALAVLLATGCSESDSPTGTGPELEQPAVWHIQSQQSAVINLELRRLDLNDHDLYASIQYVAQDSYALRLEIRGIPWLVDPETAVLTGKDFSEVAVQDTIGAEFRPAYAFLGQGTGDVALVRTGTGNLFKLGNLEHSYPASGEWELDVQLLGTAETQVSMFHQEQPLSVPAGVWFTNESLNGTDYEWLVEGPEVSNQSSDASSLSLFLGRPGSYTVTLKVRNADTGATDESSFDFGMLPPLAYRVRTVEVQSYSGDDWDGLLASNCPDIYVTVGSAVSATKDGACKAYLPLEYHASREFPVGSPLTFLRSNPMALSIYDEDPGADDLMATGVFSEASLTRPTYTPTQVFPFSEITVAGTITVEWVEP